MTYDELLTEADSIGLLTKEKPLLSADGRIKGRRVAIRQDIPTLAQKACVLAEAIGHYHTNTMDILDQGKVLSRKIERAGRLWAYDKLIGLSGIIKGYLARCRDRYELAEYLGVTEEFLQEALDCYREKYGEHTEVDGYTIMFEPSLAVIEKIGVDQR